MTILAVGRGMEPAIAHLAKDYQGRLRRLLPVELLEVAEERRPPGQAGRKEEAMAKEGRRIDSRLPEGALVVPLDGRGEALSSLDLSHRLQKLMEEEVREIVFVIGGPDGLDPSLLADRSWIFSLGPMTYPHMLVRVLLLEQLYRAMSIIKGIPYHR
ncbi:MAG: 23S rRNA (pseudouridine(1915)-N(3))-methyltransferase RlmH [Magnetococcales bacterium]|nr:23S rRNA (pseudouridine(1915)-N(3))-methyltransferase RlmH [Magnetococcales bacterium]MBF0149196.1 23S rRNA (pseudouridine(1915)-N(3))-methyltransferase RlmH [Magnetococcales bacterium]MBF0174509.1 23S rRNA (pseudouridine(1915)-N(3))-methyltransferase RlmH [Magnetococcales bacterium]MBF0348456.1 23S rRNA (pseudouridine(1915)-N(3))-methyltransferase RlmH [Magnetococcales bacterium]MBF0632516.1 23S rRNA (pseudouridine(1915)-N(3))-methyltransferase RlmH [Magnetococcales bacterium]